tara:strand:- start:1745 stop:1903 length:159 start_codon:yes stop_codon:yes gene_type:complete
MFSIDLSLSAGRPSTASGVPSGGIGIGIADGVIQAENGNFLTLENGNFLAFD